MPADAEQVMSTGVRQRGDLDRATDIKELLIIQSRVMIRNGPVFYVGALKVGF
jgi:hypothetical protein